MQNGVEFGIIWHNLCILIMALSLNSIPNLKWSPHSLTVKLVWPSWSITDDVRYSCNLNCGNFYSFLELECKQSEHFQTSKLPVHLGSPATNVSLRNCPYTCRPWQFDSSKSIRSIVTAQLQSNLTQLNTKLVLQGYWCVTHPPHHPTHPPHTNF